MAQNQTAKNSTRSGSAMTTTLRPVGAQAPVANKPGKTITREQIAKRAHDIWVKNGCRHGQDEQNWLEAERQLKAEAGL